MVDAVIIAALVVDSRGAPRHPSSRVGAYLRWDALSFAARPETLVVVEEGQLLRTYSRSKGQGKFGKSHVKVSDIHIKFLPRLD